MASEPFCRKSHNSLFVDWVVGKFANTEKQPAKQDSLWKTFALFSGATLQLATSVVVFGYLGHLLSVRWHHAFITAIGAGLGVLVGLTGLALLAKQIVGDKR